MGHLNYSKYLKGETKKTALMTNISLFSQIISKFDRNSFQKLVSRHNTDKHQKGYNSWTHLIIMLFCQFAKSLSVCDISIGLRTVAHKIIHWNV